MDFELKLKLWVCCSKQCRHINQNNRLWEVPVEEFDTVIDTDIKGTTNVERMVED